MINSNYYAVIPAELRYDKNLSAIEKLLYAEITSLLNIFAECYAKDNYFAEVLNVAPRTVRDWLAKLENKKYIKREYVYKEGTKEIKHRKIKIIKVWQESAKTCGGNPLKGMAETCQDNKNLLSEDILNKTYPDGKTVQKEKEEQIYSPLFDEFYSLYPLKKSKSLAKTKYFTLMKKGTKHATVMAGLKLYLAEIKAKGTEKQYIAHPSTWLGQGRWEDEYDTVASDGISKAISDLL